MRAATLHLLLSMLVVGAFVAAVVVFWYPPPLLQGAGGVRLILLVALVDIVLGPLVTLVVFRKGKPGLAADLAVIGLLQAAALAYGIHTAWISRPAFLVLSPYRATLVAANELYPPPSSAPLWGAEPVIVVAPADPEQRSTLLFEAVSGKPDIEYRPEHYRPLQHEALEAVHATATSVDAETIARLGGSDSDHDDWRELPLITRDQELRVVISLRSRRVLAVLPP